MGDLEFVCDYVSIERDYGQKGILVKLNEVSRSSIKDQSRELLEMVYEVDRREFEEQAHRLLG